jgi:hypothetical protein
MLALRRIHSLSLVSSRDEYNSLPSYPVERDPRTDLFITETWPVENRRTRGIREAFAYVMRFAADDVITPLGACGCGGSGDSCSFKDTAESLSWRASILRVKRCAPCRARQLKPFLVEDRGQIGADRIVVQTSGHERHRLRDTQSVAQTPAQELSVARRHQEPGAVEGLRCSDQSLEIVR